MSRRGQFLSDIMDDAQLSRTNGPREQAEWPQLAVQG